MPDPETPAVRRLDTAAVASCLRRLATLDAPPWLHGEVARRMAQRLEVIRLQPERVVDWWAFLGAGGALLDKAYPHARRVMVEPTQDHVRRSRARHRAPWWRLGGHKEPEVLLEDQAPSGAQLVWANM